MSVNISSLAWRIFEAIGIIASVLCGVVLIFNWSRSKINPYSVIEYPGSVFYTVIRYIGYMAIVIYTWCAMLRIGSKKPLFEQPEDVVSTPTHFVFAILMLIGCLVGYFLMIESLVANVVRKHGKGVLLLIIIILMLYISSGAYLIDTLQVFGLIN
jgi:hypothetical protein